MVLSKEMFNEIYSKVPRLCVEVLIKTDEGFVLSKRLIPPCVGMWHIPGGTVYFGESLDDAVRRVSLEELGIKINILSVVGVVNYRYIYKEKEHSVAVIFFCELDGYQMFQGSYQAEEIDIFHIDNIPEDTILAHKKFLELVDLRDKGDDGVYETFEYGGIKKC